ncbi:MAG: acyl carrier protein [Chloroflexota bacterium]
MTAEIIKMLTEYITGEILKQPNRELGMEAALLSSGLIDSFHLVDLAMFVEDHFGVRIDDAELNAQTFDSLQQLTDLIVARK